MKVKKLLKLIAGWILVLSPLEALLIYLSIAVSPWVLIIPVIIVATTGILFLGIYLLATD
jgi:hypothetical protein